MVALSKSSAPGHARRAEPSPRCPRPRLEDCRPRGSGATCRRLHSSRSPVSDRPHPLAGVMSNGGPYEGGPTQLAGPVVEFGFLLPSGRLAARKYLSRRRSAATRLYRDQHHRLRNHRVRSEVSGRSVTGTGHRHPATAPAVRPYPRRPRFGLLSRRGSLGGCFGQQLLIRRRNQKPSRGRDRVDLVHAVIGQAELGSAPSGPRDRLTSRSAFRAGDTAMLGLRRAPDGASPPTPNPPALGSRG